MSVVLSPWISLFQPSMKLFCLALCISDHSCYLKNHTACYYSRVFMFTSRPFSGFKLLWILACVNSEIKTSYERGSLELELYGELNWVWDGFSFAISFWKLLLGWNNHLAGNLPQQVYIFQILHTKLSWNSGTWNMCLIYLATALSQVVSRI